MDDFGGDDRTLYEVEVYVASKKPGQQQPNKGHFKVGMHHVQEGGNTDWWYGHDVVYIAQIP